MTREKAAELRFPCHAIIRSDCIDILKVSGTRFIIGEDTSLYKQIGKTVRIYCIEDGNLCKAVFHIGPADSTRANWRIPFCVVDLPHALLSGNR